MAIPEELTLVGAALPGVAAALLSAWNWWQMRRGAVIKPDRFVNYGLRNVTFEEHHRYSRKEKILYFPVLLNNVGTKAGLVSNIDIFFKPAKGANGEKKLEIARRVDVKMTGDSVSIDELVPPMPVSIPAGEGKQVTFECVDDENDVIPINEELTCRIAVRYGHNRKSSFEFPFKLTSENMLEAFRGVTWFPVFEKIKLTAEVMTDREILKDILAEINRENKLERILNRGNTNFDRTTKFGGTKLISLDLGRLELTALPESISKLEHLQMLYIGDNKLTSLPQSLGTLKQLRRLEAEKNQLTTLPESFGNLANLEYLTLYDNQLTSLPDSFGDLTSLTFLNLRYNQLSTALPESFGNLVSLEVLEMAKSQLPTLPDIGKLVNLEKAELKENQLTSLPDTIGNLRKLRDLDLDENRLVSLPDSIVKCASLRVLRVGQNQLSALPEGLDKLTRLKTILFTKNQITTLPESVEQSLEALKKEGVSVYR
ncbi:MAG: leucine-rich repeat domain-containing protein [Candidatus Heimdallarchaeota archaeon]